jgi:hypothetical protein
MGISTGSPTAGLVSYVGSSRFAFGVFLQDYAVTTSSHIYSDAELKLLRAKARLQEIDTFCKEWVKSDGNTCRFDMDPDRPGYVIVSASAVQPPVDPLSLMIGECLHNIRSALDLLAYELACAHTEPLPHEIAETSEFPIFGDEDKSGQSGVGSSLFNRISRRTGQPVAGSGRFKIRGMHPAAQDLIERLQPYQRGAAFREDSLWRLHTLDRVNKHRLLHTAAAANKGIQISVPGKRPGGPVPVVVEDLMFGVPAVFEGVFVDKDTEIASFPIRADRTLDDVKNQIGPALVIAFGSSAGDLELEPILDVLVTSYNYVASTVFPTMRQVL